MSGMHDFDEDAEDPYEFDMEATSGGGARATLDRYTIPDIATALGVKPNTVSSYNARGQMPPPSGRVGRTPYWTPDDIEPWIEGYLHGAASLRRERAAKRRKG